MMLDEVQMRNYPGSRIALAAGSVPAPSHVRSSSVRFLHTQAHRVTPTVDHATSGRADVLLACSAGGHLLQLHALRNAWDGRATVWVTDDRPDARSLLATERVVYAHWPTTRNVWTLVKNLRLAVRVHTRVRPRMLVTTGAATAVPFAWVAWLRRVPIVYVESLTRIERPSLSCRLIAPLADRVYVQWPELARAVPKGRYAGTVLGRWSS